MSVQTSWRSFSFASVVSLLALSVAHSQVGTASVDTRTSLFLAGGNAYDYVPNGGGGLVPIPVNLAAGAGRTLTLNASGTAFFCGVGVCGTTSPDGPASGAAFSSVQGVGRIGGIAAPTSGFLAALFLGPALPIAIPSQFVVTNINALTFAPGIGQVFFVGNGSTASDVLQQFLVPDGATRLYFGIADASGFVGRPEFYDDNPGTYAVNYTVTSMSAVPEPSATVLMGFGIAALALTQRKRRGQLV